MSAHFPPAGQRDHMPGPPAFPDAPITTPELTGDSQFPVEHPTRLDTLAPPPGVKPEHFNQLALMLRMVEALDRLVRDERGRRPPLQTAAFDLNVIGIRAVSPMAQQDLRVTSFYIGAAAANNVSVGATDAAAAGPAGAVLKPPIVTGLAVDSALAASGSPLSILLGANGQAFAAVERPDYLFGIEAGLALAVSLSAAQRVSGFFTYYLAGDSPN